MCSCVIKASFKDFCINPVALYFSYSQYLILQGRWQTLLCDNVAMEPSLEWLAFLLFFMYNIISYTLFYVRYTVEYPMTVVVRTPQ